jgi:hypothetical protein
MGKYYDKPRQKQRNPEKIEVRAAMNPVISPELGDGIKMTAQAHSEAMYDGTTSPHRDALSFDAVTKTVMPTGYK